VIRTVGNALRHRLWLLLAVLAICLVAGLGYVRLTKPTYLAQANLLVDARWEGAPDPDAALRASDTLTQLYIAEATSQGVLQQVIDSNRSPLSVSALAKRLSVGTVHGTTLIGIKATSSNPADAATIANAVAQALVDRNTRDVRSRFEATIASLDSELARLSTQIAAIEAEKVPAGNAAAANDHAARLQLVQNQYATVYSQRQDAVLGQARGIATLSIADRASAATVPTSPDPLRDMLAALVVGLVLGGFAVLLAERFDDRLLTAESLAEATGAPLVVNVPSTSRAARSNAYDLAHAAVRTRHPESHLLMLAAASARDRADGVASELGAAAAHAGARVLVVRSDADTVGIPHPSSNGSNGTSVTTIPLPSTTDALTGLAALANGGGQYDFAVVSVPSPENNAAALSIAGTAKLVMLVATARKTRYSEARRTAELLRHSGAELAGSIFESKSPAPRSEGPARTP
jgi:capsular polysaccharide biosynthesis protein